MYTYQIIFEVKLFLPFHFFIVIALGDGSPLNADWWKLGYTRFVLYKERHLASLLHDFCHFAFWDFLNENFGFAGFV